MGIDIQNEIRAAENGAKGLADILGVSERVAARLLLGAGAEYAVGADAAEASAVTAVVGGLSVSTGLIILLVVVGVLVLGRFVENALAGLLLRLPMGFGKGPASLVHGLFRPLDYVDNLIGATADNLVHVLLHTLVQVVGWAARQSGLHDTSTTRTIVHHETTIVQQQVVSNTTQVTDIQGQVDRLATALSVDLQSSHVPQQVWNQIHELQRDVAAQTQTIEAIHTQLQRAVATITSVEHQVVQLAAEIHGIRAVSVGWQDVETQLENLGSVVVQLVDETAAELSHQERQITQLSPLGLLLQPGVKGLRVLRSLEDKPCQCPQLPGLPNELGTALAVYEFVTHG